ncbi:hypothetical protein PIB30_037937 [Stylosanthes scabra]|uniref:Uncharacterized protein n=1 Tax=Stylosanthes scabra TaxID=79078 RepID=A0ABU6UEB7_9FABA|nr:hypothetical protein [Stylosanthes scabra]
MEREDCRGFTSFKCKNHHRRLRLSGGALLRRCPVQILTPRVPPPQRRIPPPSPHRDPVETASSFSYNLGCRRYFFFFVRPYLAVVVVVTGEIFFFFTRRRFVDFVFFIFLSPLPLLRLHLLRASLSGGGGGCDR